MPSLALRAAAELELRKRLGPARTRSRGGATRRAEDRARYAGDPWGYLADILGIELTPQQEEALDLMEEADRVLIPSANNMGKTYLLGIYGVYYMDAVAAVADLETGEEVGARVLLPGPDHPTIYATVYSKMLMMAARGEARGFKMPGRRSLDSVLWRVRPEWEVEAFSPPKTVGQEVAHTASGRHHVNQMALIEEGQGVAERVWRAAEGMCSSRGNKIISSFNPTEASGPAYQRMRTGNFRILHLDAFDHPNVCRRQIVVPGAVDFRVIDGRVRDCRDRGPMAQVQPDSRFGDFLYAAPTREAIAKGEVEEIGPREDGILGHPAFEPHVWRPTGSFQPQVRGQYPSSTDTGLFNPGAWDAAVERWLEGKDSSSIPDRLGVDAAREGADETCFGPSWGEDGDVLLQAFADAEAAGDLKALEGLTADRRVRVGELRIAPKGKGPEVAQYIQRQFPSCPWNVDESGVGASVLDHAKQVLGVSATGVSFSAVAPERLPGEYFCENTRAALYVRAAMLVDRGLVDVPDDPLLREEVMAQELIWNSRIVEERGDDGVMKKERKPSVRLLEKSEVKKKIGRSPDRADAFVLSIWRPNRGREYCGWGWGEGGEM